MRVKPVGGYPVLPPGFCLGTSTAAYQIEGAAATDGRGPSIWDTFAAQPGRVRDGSTGTSAADHYHRCAEDVALMKKLGAPAYRFSLSWSRILPTGRGRPNPAGLDFYDRLVDDLLGHGIEPLVTLYHWDLPQALEDDGGWLNRMTIDAFAEYAALAGARLGDRVRRWIPLNEPNVAAILGYGTGQHAPGRELGLDAMAAAHHLLVAHGRAVVALRESCGPGSQADPRELHVGCANHHAPVWPATDDPADVGASKLLDMLWNGAVLEPMLLGRYPADLMPIMDDIVEPGDMATIRQPLDFYGVSYEHPLKAAAASADATMPFELRPVVGYPTTDLGSPVVPDALREWLIMFRARYRAALPPIIITESGASYDVPTGADGVIDDRHRIAYLRDHLDAIAAAIARGVDVRGFYCASLLDGFEWTEGFAQHFGLVHVDPDTHDRTPKRSFEWFADLVATQPPHTG